MSTGTVKKTKAPAKLKTAVKAAEGETGSAVKTAPEVAAKTKTTNKTEKTKVKAAPKTEAIDVAASRTPSSAEIAQLAERYWADRGWQDGYAEQDWLRAEQELLGVAS
jgi:hypothetical protein